MQAAWDLHNRAHLRQVEIALGCTTQRRLQVRTLYSNIQLNRLEPRCCLVRPFRLVGRPTKLQLER